MRVELGAERLRGEIEDQCFAGVTFDRKCVHVAALGDDAPNASRISDRLYPVGFEFGELRDVVDGDLQRLGRARRR